MRILCTLILLVSFLALISIASHASGDDKETEFHKRNFFLNSAIGRLQGQVPSYWVKQVKSKTAEWQSTQTEKNWVRATDTVTFTATKYRVDSDVTIMTRPNSGATIKYQTVGQRERGERPTTTKGLTTCVENMPIGKYYIWAERKGKPTSIMSHAYVIVKPTEEVKIDEDID